MAAETTISTLTGWLTTLLSKVYSWYALDPNCAQKFVRIEPVAGFAGAPGGNVVAFTRITKDTALSATITDGTGLSNVALDTAQVTATVAEWGIMRQNTKLGSRSSMTGEEGLIMVDVRDGVQMCLEYFETLTWATYANASLSTGTSGGVFTIANVVELQSGMVTQKAKGRKVVMLPATAAKNLRTEVVASGAAIFGAGAGDGMLAATADDGHVGSFLGEHFYTNNLAGTSGANSIGAMVVDGSPGGNPEGSPTGCAVAWMPEPTPLFYNPVNSGGIQLAVTMAAGFVEVNDFAYRKIATIT